MEAPTGLHKIDIEGCFQAAGLVHMCDHDRTGMEIVLELWPGFRESGHMDAESLAHHTVTIGLTPNGQHAVRNTVMHSVSGR